MKQANRAAYCARCKTESRGKFCTECGSTLAPRVADDEERSTGVPRATVAGAVAVVALASFFIGRMSSTGTADAGGSALGARPLANVAAQAPQERANQLFDQVMRYGEAGRLDSARYVAPAAIQAYEAAGPLDAHARYDIGMIGTVTGDTVGARAQADSILRIRPTHLLGLVLAMRTAKEPAARARFAKRLVAANTAESASPLPEYADHGNDVKRGLAEAATPTRQ